MKQKSKTVLRGYVNEKDRIATAIIAGANLEAWRQGKYDYPSGDPVGPWTVPVTRRRHFDITEASERVSAITERAKIREKNRREAAEKKALEAAREGQGDAPEEERVSVGNIISSKDIAPPRAKKKPPKETGSEGDGEWLQ